jgi:hypothetical protein
VKNAAPVMHGSGPLLALMASEHRALDDLLAQAEGQDGVASRGFYERFREMLLRHIRVEEKILLPMAVRRRSGVALPLAARLRLDHGALAALMMLPPAAYTFRAVRAVLNAHNPLEENPGGVYQQCEDLAGVEADRLLEQVIATPRVPVSPWADSPKVVDAAKRILARASYDPALLDPVSRDGK